MKVTVSAWSSILIEMTSLHLHLHLHLHLKQKILYKKIILSQKNCLPPEDLRRLGEVDGHADGPVAPEVVKTIGSYVHGH